MKAITNNFKIYLMSKLEISNVESFQQLIDLIMSYENRSEFIRTIEIISKNEWIIVDLLEMKKQKDTIYKNKISHPNDKKFKADFKTFGYVVNNKINMLKNRYFKTEWENTGNNVKKQLLIYSK